MKILVMNSIPILTAVVILLVASDLKCNRINKFKKLLISRKRIRIAKNY